MFGGHRTQRQANPKLWRRNSYLLTHSLIGGHIKALLPTIKSIFDRFGQEVTDQLSSWVSSQQAAMKAIAERENIDCDLFVTRSFDAYFEPEQAKTIKSWLDEQRRANAAWTRDVQWLEGPNLERVSLKNR
jgi:hypothetical protein